MFILAALLAGHLYIMGSDVDGEHVPVLMTKAQCEQEALPMMRKTMPPETEFRCVPAEGSEETPLGDPTETPKAKPAAKGRGDTV